MNRNAFSFILSCAILALFVYVFGPHLISRVEMLSDAGLAQGRVVDLDVTHGRRTYVSPHVAFRSETDGSYDFRSFSNNSIFSTISLGQRVPVIYQRSNPNNAEINLFWQMWGPFLFAVIFLGLIAWSASISLRRYLDVRAAYKARDAQK